MRLVSVRIRYRELVRASLNLCLFIASVRQTFPRGTQRLVLTSICESNDTVTATTCALRLPIVGTEIDWQVIGCRGEPVGADN